MSHCDRILNETLKTQRRIGRLAERDYGLSLKRISIDSNMPYSTIRSYFGQGDVKLSELPLSAFIKLCGVIPDQLLSQLLSPADRHLERDEEDEDTEYDDLADQGDNVARLVRQARHPQSPGGTEIVAVEEEAIRQAATCYGRKQARLQAVA